MANTEVITLIIQLTADLLKYMIPVIAVLSAIMLLLSFLLEVTINSVKKF